MGLRDQPSQVVAPDLQAPVGARAEAHALPGRALTDRRRLERGIAVLSFGNEGRHCPGQNGGARPRRGRAQRNRRPRRPDRRTQCRAHPDGESRRPAFGHRRLLLEQGIGTGAQLRRPEHRRRERQRTRVPRQREEAPQVGAPIAGAAHHRGIDDLLPVQPDASADQPDPGMEPEKRRYHFLDHRRDEIAPLEVQQLVADDAPLERRIEPVEGGRQHHGRAEQAEAAGHPDIRTPNEGGRHREAGQSPRGFRPRDPVRRAGEPVEPRQTQPEPRQPDENTGSQEPQNPRPGVDAPAFSGEGDDAPDDRDAGAARELSRHAGQGRRPVGGCRRDRLPRLDPRRQHQQEEDGQPVLQQEAAIAKPQNGDSEPGGHGHHAGLHPVGRDVVRQQLSRHRRSPAR